MKKMIAAFVVLAFALTSCGAGSDKDTAAELEKSQERIAELEAAASETTVAETTPTFAETTTAPPTTAAPTTAAPTPEALMPDVVCMNLQEAQDFIQSETGVFLSLSEDATGGGRMQMIDSNWIVVAQRPAVGTPIGEGDAVLSAVKLTEPNDC